MTFTQTFRYLLLVLCFFISIGTFGQDFKHQVIGKVVAQDLAPISAATVTLTDGARNIIATAVTDSLGAFTLRFHETDADHRITVRHLGYQEYTYAMREGHTKDLGTIQLIALKNVLSAVEVKAKPKLIEVSGGTIIYNVENSIGGKDVSALEALKRAPGVYVENESAITLNGKGGVQILIDGRQTYLSGSELTDLLKSISSNDLKSIEVINSPTAKFDASGAAGIINIKTKKNQITGLNGNITSAVAYGISPKQLQNMSVNYRVDKINVFGSYNHTLGNYNYIYGSDRTQNGKNYTSDTDDIDKRQKMSTRMGIDYFLNEKNTIGFLANGNFIFGGGITDTRTEIRTLPSTVIEETLDAVNDYYGQGTSRYNFNLNYRYEDTLGRTLQVNADYGLFDKWNKNLQSNTYRNRQGLITEDNLYRTLNDIDIDMMGVQIDYSTKLWEGVLEAGLKYSQVGSANDSRFFHVMPTIDSLDNRRSNDFNFTEKISSAYVDYKRTMNNWSFQGGLRLELANSEGLLSYREDGKDMNNVINRKFTNLFPFLSVTKPLGANQNLSLSYAKRIERPAYPDLNPFIYMLDELSFWQGNPFLNPQLTHRLTLLYSLKNATVVTFNVAYSDQFNAKVTDTLETEKIVMISRNVGTQKHWSLALTQNYSPKPWWELSFNGLLYYIQNDVSFDDYRNLNLRQVAGRVSLLQTFRLPFAMKAEIAATYNSNRLSGANIFAKAISQVDVGVQKSLLKDKASLRIAVTDIYKGNQSRSNQSFPGFQSSNYGYFESQQVRLSFSYNFSKGQSSAQRTRKSALESESGRIQ
ncbi:outer membrane beta-barrel protein [Sphingobacterium paludis]|uniref:Outer membrane receptor protein involved in Fe transport n=1 Tax=Sphingobacterium paludis TaxID=1476465 RepID=A0A4R7D0P8_9SPHI|nr:outer membrane beta-barrel protein [Sphingobacterium paludis]TDS13887.1 outer membrane receptor protein involved in Fe transport [Sphingobacterium paludis]